jgi:ankyrin repeat protein
MSSIGSNSPDPRHLKLVQASAAGREEVVKQLLTEATWHSQMDRDALRQSLQRCAARGNLSLSRFLIEKGAEVDARKAEVAALFRAAENGHVKVVNSCWTLVQIPTVGQFWDAIDKGARQYFLRRIGDMSMSSKCCWKKVQI